MHGEVSAVQCLFKLAWPNVTSMRLFAALLLSLTCAAPSGAQWQPAPAPPRPALSLSPSYSGWNPTSDYVEPGQDEPGYRAWIARGPWRAGQVRLFHDYLTASGVAFVAPTWQLLRTASDWRRCGAEPFEIPPTEEWANIVNTLRYVRDHVVPVLGPVEPVSVFRNAALNRCAGGAPESVHKSMSAIDFVPLNPMDRSTMIRRLCAEHQRQGPRFNAGLGFYTKMRFHVDSWRYRTWGRNDHGHAACPKVEWQPPVLASAPAEGSAGTQPGAAASGSTASPQASPAPLPALGTAGPVTAPENPAAVPGSASILQKPPESVGTTPAKDPLAPL
jgi:hypothetical protein